MLGSTPAGNLCRWQMFCRYSVSGHLRVLSLSSLFRRPLSCSEIESKPYRSLLMNPLLSIITSSWELQGGLENLPILSVLL